MNPKLIKQRITGSRIKKVRLCPGWVWVEPGQETSSVEAEMGKAVHTYYETGECSEHIWDFMPRPPRPEERMAEIGHETTIFHETKFAWNPVTGKSEWVTERGKERDYSKWPIYVVTASADAVWRLPDRDGKQHWVVNDLKTGWPEKPEESAQLVFIAGALVKSLGLTDGWITLEIVNATRNNAKHKHAGKVAVAEATFTVQTLLKLFDSLVKNPILKALIATDKDTRINKECHFCSSKPNCPAYLEKNPNYGRNKEAEDEVANILWKNR